LVPDPGPVHNDNSDTLEAGKFNMPGGDDIFSRTQSANCEQSINSLYNMAVQFHKAGMLADAETKFRQALLRNKRHVGRPPRVFSPRVFSRLSKRRRKTLKPLWPLQVPSLVGLGALLRERGDEEGGRKLLQEASGQIASPVLPRRCMPNFSTDAFACANVVRPVGDRRCALPRGLPAAADVATLRPGGNRVVDQSQASCRDIQANKLNFKLRDSKSQSRTENRITQVSGRCW
jgi:hypothetical protein